MVEFVFFVSACWYFFVSKVVTSEYYAFNTIQFPVLDKRESSTVHQLSLGCWAFYLGGLSLSDSPLCVRCYCVVSSSIASPSYSTLQTPAVKLLGATCKQLERNCLLQCVSKKMIVDCRFWMKQELGTAVIMYTENVEVVQCYK